MKELWYPEMEGAEDIPMPEYPSCTDKSQEISGHLVQWLTDDTAYTQKVNCLKSLADEYATSGASGRAADFILAILNKPESEDFQQAA